AAARSGGFEILKVPTAGTGSTFGFRLARPRAVLASFFRGAMREPRRQPRDWHQSNDFSGKVWLGDLDSNQD
ncbi:MAG TPA: hypothetical protein PLJ34_09345, partial [Hyphomicrobiales bacterium]|nr:hypothetical protein [Hyphomicrobiales bacterium]